MKLLSFVVPSYNSEKFMSKCVDSLVCGGEEVEVIIVNDGSKDNTLKIANEYLEKYPNIVKVIDKENGGHGSTINAALEIATGIYFKCVDSDDWVDYDAYMRVLDVMREHYKNNTLPDMYVSNFVYERLCDNTRYIDEHKKRFPVGQIVTWDRVKKFAYNEFLMMHNIIFKTNVLKDNNVHLLEHTFYVDNLFIYEGMKGVKTLYYIDVNFYRYFIGREDQSVNLANMTKNYKMQLRVMREMALRYTYDELKSLPKKHYQQMIHELKIISFLTLFYIASDLNYNRKKDYKDFAIEFKTKNRKLYNKIRYRTNFFVPFLLISPLRRKVVLYTYHKVVNKRHWN